MPTMKFDAIDMRILTALQRDARITNVALAEAVGISPSPCLRRVRQLEESGVIDAYVTRLSAEAIGFGVTAFVSIRIEKHGQFESEAFKKAICELPQVVACYMMAGSTDCLAQVVATDLPAYSRLMMTLGDLAAVKDLESRIVIEALKPWSELPLGQADQGR